MAPAVKPRPVTLEGRTYKFGMGCGNVYVTVNHDEEGRPLEIFTYMGKGGGCTFAFSESVSRAISQSLRSGIDVGEIIKQQRGISCPMGQWNEGVMVTSCSDAIAKALSKHIEEVDDGTQ